MELTFQGLKIILPLEGVIQAEDFSLTASFNRHAEVSLLLLMEEERIEESVHGLGEGAEIEVFETQPLFAGKITETEMKLCRGQHYIKLKAVSYTMDWQLAIVSQSFLNLDATYEQVMKKVLENQPQAEILDCITGGARIPDFLLQYEETDWDFLVRLASHFQSFLIPDYKAAYGRAYFGMPQYGEEVFLREEDYQTVKDMDRYYQVNPSGTLLSQEIMKWKVRCGQTFHLAQRVAFRGLGTIVTSIEYRTVEGALCRYYELSREKGVLSVPIKNPRVDGMSIPATVKERSGNCVRVHFHIDPVYDTSPNIRYFTYAIESSFIYCMPEVDSQVHIYFPTDEEKDAVAVHAVRMSTGGGYAQNPDNKSFSNVDGAELLMTPALASVASGGSSASACMNGGDVRIEGGQVAVSAGNNMTVGNGAVSVSMRANSITASVGEGQTCISLTEEISIIAAFVKIDASDSSPASPSAEELMKMLTEGDAQRRDEINQGLSEELINKYKEGVEQILNGAVKTLAAIGTVVLAVGFTVATGGAGAALVAPMMLGTYALAGTTVAFAAADMWEGAQNISKSQTGDLSESFNFIRDTAFQAAFGENKYAAYEVAKVVNDIAFEVVSGKAVAGAMSKTVKLLSGSEKAHNFEGAVEVGRDTLNWAVDSLIHGQADMAGLFGNMALGALKVHAGNRLPDKILGKLGIVGEKPVVKGTVEILTGTVVDTSADGLLYGLTGKEFDLGQSLAQNALANGLTVIISDPADAATGSFMLHETDVILSSIPVPLQLERNYRSASREVSVLGRGWQFPYASRLYRDTAWEGRVHLDTITGHTICFEQENGRWANKSRGTGRFSLETEEGKGYILTDVTDHTRCGYDENGRLMCVEYPNSQKLLFSYTGDGLSRITTPLGNVLEVESREGRILQITDEIGRRTQYRYEGDLLTDVVYTDEGITHYAYDEEGHITSIIDQNGVQYLENRYDEKGRIVRQSFADGVCMLFEYDDRQRRTTITNCENGRKETYVYNKELLTERILYEDGTSVSYTYSDQNLRIGEVSRTGAETRREYDTYGRLLLEQDPEGFVRRYAYDENHDLVRKWDTDGREICHVYDSRHNLIQVKEKIADGQWKETLYRYDEKGRCISIQDGCGNVTLQQYEENRAYPARVITPNGEETVYGYDRVGRRMSIGNAYGTVQLSYNSRNYMTGRTDGEGYESRWFYDRMGKLAAYYPAKQWKNQTDGYEYRYDFLERQVDTISPLKRHKRLFRDFDGNVLRTVHPVSYAGKGEDGEGTVYDYDQDGNRIRIHYADGGIERRFYDADGHMLRQIMPEDYDRELDDGAGYGYTYDRQGRLISIRDPEGNCLHRYTYNGHDQMICEVDGEGQETLYEYNGLGLLTRKQVSAGRKNGTAYYRVIGYSYDMQGNKTEEAYGRQEVVRDGEPSGWHRIYFTYDGNNHLIGVRDDLGAVIRYTYDCLGNRTQEEQIVEEGIRKKICYQYNKNGWRIQKTEEIQGNGPVKTAITRYGYDENGNLIYVRLPGGMEMYKSYDEDDRLTGERMVDQKNGIDRRLTYVYDEAGNLIRETLEGPHIRPLVRTRQYDGKDRLIHETDWGGAVLRRLYDKNDRLIREISPFEGTKETDGEAGTVYSYDSRGNRIRVENALGQVVEERRYTLQDMPSYVRDGLGNETELSYMPDGSVKELRRGRGEEKRTLQQLLYNDRGQITGIVDGNGVRKDYELDDWGRLTAVRFSGQETERYSYTPAGRVSESIDGNGGRIRYRYNSMGKIRERIDQSGGREQFLYDGEGNLTCYVDRDGNEIHRRYDGLGNLIYEKAVDSKGENPCISTYRYDSIGRLVQAVSGGHSYEYEYDAQGRLREKRSGGRRLISYVYNQAGQVIQREDPAGLCLCFSYDSLGRTSRIVGGNGMELRYEYDCLNRPVQLSCGNGIRTFYQYDEDGNVSHLQTRDGERILLSFTCRYDGNGNRILKTGTQGAEGEKQEVSCRYDALGQLLEEKRNQETVRYAYDAAGNRVRKEEGGRTTEYLYNEKNQLVCAEDYRGKTVFTYSPQGSILREEGPEGIRKYTYNSKNQQIRVELSDGRVQKNRYDAEGLRYEMEENGRLLQFVYQNGTLLYEKDQQESVETSYCIVDGRSVKAMQRSGETGYYHQDEQQSTLLLTDRQGNVCGSYTYDAFGRELTKEERISNRIRYCGQQCDRLTGQYYMRARYYHPRWGRFLQEDSYQGDGLNLYAYCGNNPVAYSDPRGYRKKCAMEGKIGGDGGEGYSVDPIMLPVDIAEGKIVNGAYVTNPTAHNITDYINEGSNYLGSKHMNGNYTYVIDMDGNIIVGTRNGQRMPHPTLIGGKDPRVQAAGIIDIRGGKIHSVNNASGHYKPGSECLEIVENAFGNLPQNIFSKDFIGYIPFEE